MAIDSLSTTAYTDPYDDVSPNTTIFSAQWNGKFNTLFSGVADVIDKANSLIAWHNDNEGNISDVLGHATALGMSDLGFSANNISLTPALTLADLTASNGTVSVALANDAHHVKFNQSVECDLIAPDAGGLDIVNSGGDTTLTINGDQITSSSGTVTIEGVSLSGGDVVASPGFPHASDSVFTYGGTDTDTNDIPSEYSYAKGTLTDEGILNLDLPAGRPIGDAVLVEADNQASVTGTINIRQSDETVLETVAAGEHKVFFLLRIYNDANDFYTVFSVDK